MKNSKQRGRPPGSEAAHRRIVDRLRKRLIAEEWAKGMPLPSTRQLAAEYGVGHQVIRLALKVLQTEDRISISPRRNAVAKSQGYVVSALSNLVALVVSHNLSAQWENPAEHNVRKGIEIGMAKETDPLLVVHDSKRLRNTIPPDLLDLPIRGILLVGRFEPQTLQKYSELGTRCVLVDQGKSDFISSVSVDNESAAFDATSRLIAMGHRNIAFLRFVQLSIRDVDPDGKERECGYRKAFAEAKIPLPKNGIHNFFSNDTHQGRGFQAILNATPAFTAVVTVDGRGAELLEQAAFSRGLCVPKDLSIVSFLGLGVPDRGWSGPRIDFEAIGRESVLLLRLDAPYPRKLLLPAPWENGKTVAPRTS